MKMLNKKNVHIGRGKQLGMLVLSALALGRIGYSVSAYQGDYNQNVLLQKLVGWGRLAILKAPMLFESNSDFEVMVVKKWD